ncbi:DUF1958 domain-containing protein [Staphylococcus massiliensis]|uniref:DUF1958 domain-containing protein n=1 Tax=Staphylococcus massiliensis TaxID=555791 RepID=UPI001EDF63D0|nr:DUF1958 domain-containing protein [Staphylococcus massiliensis]MCG3401448.1 DUF1958 domain-containing protein [Staphylococcus massiliensis]
MRKLHIILSLLLILNLVFPTHIYSKTSPLEPINQDHRISKQYTPNALAVTTESGQILYQYHYKSQVDPASLTKMMTMYLTLEQVENGNLSLDDTVKITPKEEKLSKMPSLASFKLNAGETYTIDQLLKQTAIVSSNAATMVLGRKIAGSPSKFTHRMNDKAKALGMTHTHFVNPTGASNDLLKPFEPIDYRKELKTSTTAEDLSLLMHHLLKDHKQVLNYSKLNADVQKGRKMRTTNLSLPGESRGFKGSDGLKTGTSDNGYNLALTNHKDNLRLNVVVLNVKPYPSDDAEKMRHTIANRYVKQMREKYEYKKVLSKGRHEINDKVYDVKTDLYDVVPKNMKNYSYKINEGRIELDYDRSFIKGTKAPSVGVEKVDTLKDKIMDNLLLIIVSILFLLTFILAITLFIMYRIYKRSK